MTSDDVVRIEPPYDRDGTEGWTRAEHEPDIGGVEVFRYGAERWTWQVVVQVMEFVREDPLETRLRNAILAGLRAVPGIVAVEAEDRESWVVAGEPVPQELVRAVARVVDSFADEARAHEAKRSADSMGATSNSRSLRRPVARNAHGAIYKVIAVLSVSSAVVSSFTHPDANTAQWLSRLGMAVGGVAIYVGVVMRDGRGR